MDTYKSLRKQMVETQIRPRMVRSDRVLEAMAEVPRHRFVAPEIQAEAYEDYPLPIACGQTISQPYIVALIAELCELEGHEKVLEIGAGCGYQAAVLSRLAKEVYAVEWHAELAAEAARCLAEIGYRNVQVTQGDGKLGWPEKAPFDRLVVSCALGSAPPIAWDEQLAPGGLLVFPQAVGATQWLYRWRKVTADQWEKETVCGVKFVPLL